MSKLCILFMIIFCSLILLLSCATESFHWKTYEDSAPHSCGLVTVAPGVKIHYLDFGGTGDVLLLIAGSGNSAHVYDTFAPLLTDSFHVIALTRRGFGESSHPASGYNPATLAGDIHAFMDTQGITQAYFAGHSIAGVEMTEFAVEYPLYVKKIVYLDAAYDWALQSAFTDLPIPPTQPDPGAADISSCSAYAAYWARMNGVPSYPEADVWATSALDSHSNFIGSATSEEIMMDFGQAAAAVHPDYAGVQAPTLAIFTVSNDVEDLFPWIIYVPSKRQAAIAFQTALQPNMEAVRDNFRNKATHGTVIEMISPHYVFLHDPTTVADTIRAFLLEP